MVLLAIVHELSDNEDMNLKIRSESLLFWALVAFLMMPMQSEATVTLSIKNPQYSNWGVAAQIALEATASALEVQFNDTLATADSEQFLTQVGNANAMATRSILSPGTAEPSNRFGASFNVNWAVAGGMNVNPNANSLPPVGVAAQSGFTVGANGDYIKLFNGLDPKRVMYHLSFYKVNIGSYFPRSGITSNALQVSTGLSYQLYPRRNWLPGIDFNGIHLSSSFSLGQFSASYTTPFNLSSAGISMNSDVTMTVDSTVVSFSNEATVGIRLFYLFDFFTGIGMDVNVGSTNLTGVSSGGAVSATDGAGVVGYSADAEVSGDAGSAAPTTAQLRLIAGTQFNTGPFALFVQGNASTPNAYSLNFGAKFGF